jgi:hypothetical protein
MRIAGLDRADPFNLHRRHSRECGNPLPPPLRLAPLGQSEWMPAFAGMTIPLMG